MARDKVENKYRAILDAAIAVFAERGFWDTPTSLVSRTAGIADGTLFTYFKTKNDLINEVYLDIKKDLSAYMMENVTAADSIEEGLRQVWNAYTGWGVRQPEKFKVLQQLTSSYDLPDEVKAQSMQPFVGVEHMLSKSVTQGTFRDYPPDYMRALIEVMAGLTVQFISAEPEKLAYYQQIGFEVLSNGVMR